MALSLLDTNILLRHLTNDHVDHSPRSTAYLTRIEDGELRVRVPDTVIFEVAYALQKIYKEPRTRVRELLLPILSLPGMVMGGKRRWRRALDIFAAHNVSVADAYHAALMEHEGLDTIITFDRGFDKIPGIIRVEP